MFDRLKAKLHRRKNKKQAAKGPLKPNDPSESSSATASPSPPEVLVDQAPVPTQTDTKTPPAETIHKSSNDNGRPTEKPVQPTPPPAAPVKDLWQDALQQLPTEKQERLKSMGFDRLDSKTMETDIDDLVGVVKQKQEECEQKFWRVTVGDNDIVLRNYTTKIVGWLEKAGDIAIQFAPPQASLPWSVIKQVMQVSVIEDEQMAALLGATEKIVRIISRGQVYEQVYLSNAPGKPADKLSSGLQDALVKIYSTSLDLLADSGNLFSKNTARRTLEAIMNPGSVSGGLATLASQEDELLRDVQACESRRSAAADDRMIGMLDAINAPLTRVDENVQSVLEHMQKSSRIELLEWISAVPFGEHHGDVKEKRTPGTGEWLLQDRRFHEWEGASSSGIFWLRGSPGTGKTYLTSRVIDLVQGTLKDPPKDEGFAFFYCEKNEASRGDAQSILQSYVRQLSTTTSSPGSIQTQLKEACEKARSKGSSLRLDECKKQILQSVNLYPKTTIVLDAFDECDLESRDQLMDALNSIISDSNNIVRVFISSRPDPDIQTLLERSTSIDIQASHNRGDIQHFLEEALDKLAKKSAFIGRLKSRIVEKLLERCQGMFQWASLQIHQILRCKTETSVWKRLENLPEDLQNAYDEIWDEIDSLEEPDKSLTKRALTWVMCAYKPMTSETLLSAIRVGSKDDDLFLADEIDEQGLLSLCNNFLVIDSKLKVWRFSHLSVIEYLGARHKWTLPQAHCYAATACLSFFVNIYADKDPSTVAELPAYDGYDSEWDDPEDRPEKAAETYEIHDTTNSFHIYIRHHWVIHVHASQSSEESTVASLLKSFLGAPEESSIQYRRWFQQVRNDCWQLKPCIDKSGWDISGFDNTFFDKYESVYAYGGDYTWGSELEPADVSIFAMCRFAFHSILSSWWENKEIDISRLNDRGHNLLMVAAIGGCVPICKNLIARGIDVDSRHQTRDYGSALVAAAHKGQTEAVKCLVDAGADVNLSLPEDEGWFGNALVAAVDAGRVETTKYLVQEAKADVNMPPLKHEIFGNALGRAASNGDDEIVRHLVEAGAHLNEPLRQESGFYGVLEAIIIKGDLKTLKYLVQKGADVNMPLQGKFGSALEAATDEREIESVKYLVEEAHANVNYISLHGQCGSPLAAAAGTYDNIEIVKYLVQEAGASVNQPLRSGEYGSALAAAACFGQIEHIKCMMEAGADVNMMLPHGKYGSALAAAASHDDTNMNIVKYVLEAGADLNMPLSHGEYGSALAAAAHHGSVESLSFLVNAGADVNMQLPGGKYGSALAAAVAKWNSTVEVVEYLKEQGADVNMPLLTGVYGSALAAAACDGSLEALKCLLDAGADVNMPLKGGRYGSALAAAVDSNNLEKVEILVEAQADVNIWLENRDCGNAITRAVVHCYGVEILEYFIGAGADVNQINPGGKYGSALIAAAYLGKKHAVECLVNAGADVNLKLENVALATALQASQSPVSSEDMERTRQEQDYDEAEAERKAEWEEGRAEVTHMLQQHGATA